MPHKDLLFGTAGTPISTKQRSSAAGIKRIRQLGLDCMELEFVHGVRMKEDTATIVFETARTENMALSVHAPYYINLNSAEQEKVGASIRADLPVCTHRCPVRCTFHCVPCGILAKDKQRESICKGGKTSGRPCVAA